MFSSEVFVTIPKIERSYQEYDFLASWFHSPLSQIKLFEDFYVSGTVASGELFLNSLSSETLLFCNDYETCELIPQDKIRLTALKTPHIIELLYERELYPRFREKLNTMIANAACHSNLSSIWVLATMLKELGEHKDAIGLFELGQNLCIVTTDPTDNGIVIYDWLLAAVTCWRYRKLSKAKEYLDWAEGMVDDDTREEFNEVRHRIKTAPFQAIWTQCNLSDENTESIL